MMDFLHSSTGEILAYALLLAGMLDIVIARKFFGERMAESEREKRQQYALLSKIVQGSGFFFLFLGAVALIIHHSLY